MGGSYPGSLAAWMRLKYPHLVLGAVSTSGPLLALINFEGKNLYYMYIIIFRYLLKYLKHFLISFPEYFDVVKDSLSSYNPECVTTIEAGTKQIMSLLIHPLGQRSIFKMFKLCDPLELNNEDDNSNLFESLAGNFAGVVQYNKDNRHDQNSGGSDLTIDYLCDIMLNQSLGKEINRLAVVNEVVLNKTTKEKCLDYKYDKMIKQMQLTDWESEVAEGGRQWTYQTCTEFGFFQTSSLNTTKQMFGNKFPPEFFLKQCTDIFGIKYNANLTEEGIIRTNMIYGGLNLVADNIVFVHGSIDPWHALGITKTLRPGAPAIYIQGNYIIFTKVLLIVVTI